MSAALLPFLLGVTAGGLLTWPATVLDSYGRTPVSTYWTVAAITSRIELERREEEHANHRPRTANSSEREYG
ncbi:hypothetical protein [Nocardia seriolae]|uniref:Uncharacterized protein n=1 Tax=Nocardia seriolae TaxID=37332 RepID=A0A0B8NNC6_9NOCA|nr:hypothetical protein [Nocardia seriolae]APA97253.1 hypothetical protein NS506_03200 [Nocardia seriolae]MTJ62179.1 hypothetical protein [Nocardia seriolae]MTJ74638.1 hypothetical protein [Nocardia seriolae]MTJ87090.1 hypothetical protein [Nocardia seriolae]MTK31084.1 hypothetical protein [Nocardia seriolae]